MLTAEKQKIMFNLSTEKLICSYSHSLQLQIVGNKKIVLVLFIQFTSINCTKMETFISFVTCHLKKTENFVLFTFIQFTTVNCFILLSLIIT